MNKTEHHPEQQPAELVAIAEAVENLAATYAGNDIKLLTLLRLLEALHRQIRDGAFQDALPHNRQALYALVRDMEIHGGWPYIPTMKLRELIQTTLYELVSLEDTAPNTGEEAPEK
jgi:hypothetical protein